MILIALLLAMTMVTFTSVKLLGSIEEIPAISCVLAIVGCAMVVRDHNILAAAFFVTAAYPIGIKYKQKAQLWHDLQGQEAGKADWTCPDFYDSLDWDDTVQWRQEWWDG